VKKKQRKVQQYDKHFYVEKRNIYKDCD